VHDTLKFSALGIVSLALLCRALQRKVGTFGSST
jgi:hypothetical protein